MKNLTALMFAAPFGSPEMVKALLDAGADVKMQDDRGMTPLMFSVASDNQDVRVAKLLIEHGSDVNATSSTGETVLDWARKFNEPAVVALLEKAGAKSNPLPLAPPRSRSAWFASRGMHNTQYWRVFEAPKAQWCRYQATSSLPLSSLPSAS